MINLPKKGSSRARAAAEWSEDSSGAVIKRLLDDPSGYRTMQMKVEPGPLGEAHSHAEVEQVYVLEGDFFDEQGSYAAGDLVVRAAGAMHRSGSANGCTMLLIYTPAMPGR
jgi:anti-sigma factor ChrR (cupin superfamily)